jgi:ABC-2 type transport system ATP-binding protein
MGLLFPTSGTARILGKDIADFKMHQRIGYCPENPYFYDYLTASELMNYFGEIFGMSAAVRKERSSDLLTRVGLDEKDWNKQLRKFSKGMLQRVGLAQALINEPEVVFLDEPMSGLDPIGRREIRELIDGLGKSGTTVFMSTHILSDVEALCNEVAILRRGRLAATGNLDDLLSAHSGEEIYEITVKGVSAEALAGKFPMANITPKANGVTIEVSHDSEINNVIAGVRVAGGRLISVQAVRQSLEELFVEKTEAS